MKSQLEITQSEAAPGVALIKLTGRLMLGLESAQLESIATGLFENGTRKVIIDFGAVTHIDSTGIGRCIACLNKAMQVKGQLHMACAKGQVRDSFRVTRLDRMFRFFDTIEQAVAAFKN
ncbi:MAG TPA: STAS domain-containing protein [Bryobacteraceae bacterium]|jgi:anti-anti-sigma factor